MGIGVYGVQSSSYGTPTVTIQNVTVSTSGSVTLECEFYIGILNMNSDTFDAATDTSSATTVYKTGMELTILDSSGNKMLEISDMSTTEASAIRLNSDDDSVTIAEKSVVNSDVLTENLSATFSGVVPGTNGITLTAGYSSTSISGVQASGTIYVNGTISVASGDSYSVEAGAAFTTSGSTTMTLYGDLVSDGGTVVNNGTIVLDGGSVSDGVTNNGTITSVSYDNGSDRRNPVIIDNSSASTTDDDDEAVKVVACAAAAAAAALMAAFFLLDARKK